MDWKPYPRNRKIAHHEDGFVIIVPDDAEPAIPLTCPVCSHVLRSRDDEMAFNEFSCCNRCSMIWAASRRDEWKTGWRPLPEDVASREADRLPIATTLDVD